MTHDAEQLAGNAATLLPHGGLREALERAAREQRPLRVKLGIDPSGAELTLGHAVILRKLRQFQDAGHTAVLVLGEFTGQIGDPTGRSSGRPALTAEETRRNAEGYLAQALTILSEEGLEVVSNREWFDEMEAGELISWMSRLTLAQLLERDDFSKRFEAEIPISLSELSYPLLQGIDSVKVRADVELGGSDQLYNLLVGRDLQRVAGQVPQVVMTLPILVGLDGTQKMSKSLQNFVSITEDPSSQFGKLMSIPDTCVGQFARLAAWMDEERVREIEGIVSQGGPSAGRAKREVAAATIALLSGTETAKAAEASFDQVFRAGSVPDEMPSHELEDGEIEIIGLLVELGFARSRTEAHTAVRAGAVRVSGAKVSEPTLSAQTLRGQVLQLGKRRFVRLT